MARLDFLNLVSALLVLTGMVQFMNAAEHPLEQKNRQLVQAAFEAWRDGKGSVFDLLDADAPWTIVGNAPVSRTYKSKQEFMDVVIAPFNARLSAPLRPSVRHIYADGDTAVALFDGKAIARDGMPYRNTYTWFMKLKGEKIIEVTAFFDTIEFTNLWTRIKP